MNAASTSPRVHDLLQLTSPALDDAFEPQPRWALDAIRQCPWVVVRRAMIVGSRLPVGVRGSERWQRRGCFVASEQVGSVRSPHQLRSGAANSKRLMLPALRTLAILEDEWSELPVQWGPGGSAGYELAAGMPALRSESDLDIVIDAPEPIGRDFARRLLATTLALPAPVDVRVETPACGFSLREYAKGIARLLVRTPAGGRLAPDPWKLEDD